MKLQELKTAIAGNQDQQISIIFSDGNSLAPHFHITEVGKVTKDFVDCGGTRRQSVSCTLQTYVAGDTDHRLLTTKLAKILDMTDSLALEGSVEVEVEIQSDTISTHAVETAVSSDGRVVIQLAAKKTACLAPDKCGIPEVPMSIPLATGTAAASEGDCCGGGGGG
ncbi:MAG: DUF6428 family protein [Mariniblastus sp.]